MHARRMIELNGEPVAGGKQPLICTPLIARTRNGVLAEVAKVRPKKPDILEWRVDFFDAIGKTNEFLETEKEIGRAAGNIPVLFPRRSVNEGGEKIALSEDEVVKLYEAVCDSRCVEM